MCVCLTDQDVTVKSNEKVGDGPKHGSAAQTCAIKQASAGH